MSIEVTHRTGAAERRSGYLPIGGYGVIGNLRTAALVAVDASIDWLCLPWLDSPSVFGALVDAGRGGRFRVSPVDGEPRSQCYLRDSNVLLTRFAAGAGRLTVTDFMPLHGTITGTEAAPTGPELYRVLCCYRAPVEVELEWSPRFDYAREVPRLTRRGGVYWAQDGDHRLSLRGVPAGARPLRRGAADAVRLRFRMRPGERVALLTRYGAADLPFSLEGALQVLERTLGAWRHWVGCGEMSQEELEPRWRGAIVRSALVLKLVTHPDTGAIAAAPTTSLPEEIGGVRNWDYRYTWLRDASFTAQALMAVGHTAEAVNFLRFSARVCQEAVEEGRDLQIMYGLRGALELPEQELGHLEGYRGSRPVRVGNAAHGQRQHDVYGELIAAAWEIARIRGGIEPGLWRFLRRVADRACVAWKEPDCGIWEIRLPPRHYVYSKVMVWVALDRAARMAEAYGLPGDVARWRAAAREIRGAVLAHGYDPGMGAFVQAFGSRALDAANLRIPLVEFLPFDDPRVQGTIDRTLERLTHNGMVRRYRSEDGIPGGEGAFGLTTFWLIDALALSGRTAEATALFEGMLARANHLGLLAEELDPDGFELLGNFPQAFTHIGLINSALYLSRVRRPGRAWRPGPIGTREHRLEAGHDPGAAA